MPVAERQTVDYALHYAKLGWHVFPCWWVENGACACGDVSCKSPGKHPIANAVPRGHLDASIAPQKIQGWWRMYPQAHIAVYLSASGLVAIDIDPRNGGTYTMEQIEAEHGALRSDVLAFTGGGGEHRVFSAPSDLGGLPGKLGPGIDVKLNGYIIVEPSGHVSGRSYTWEGESDPLDGALPSPLPDWLRGFSAPISQAPTQAAIVAPATVRDLRSALAHMRSDDRDQWVSVGHALKSLGDTGRGLWLEWSQTSDKYDARDAAAKWETFQPTHTGYQAVFSRAQTAGWVNTAGASAARQEGPVIEAGESLLLSYDALTTAAGQLSWTVKRILPQQSVGVMFGASGTFKSFIALDGCLHVAHGMKWAGQRTKKGPVVYLAAEGSVGIARRVTAWHNARRLNPQDADIRFCIRPLSLLTQAALLRKEIEALDVAPVMIVIDTMSQTFNGEENASSEVAEYLRAIRVELAHAFGACVLVIHHSGHAATERPRGSSAIRANSDFLIGVFRDEKDMLATVEIVHQKDGELLPPMTFGLTSVGLGTDSDGDAVTSLAARHLDCAADVLETAQKNRSGAMAQLIEAVGTGAPLKTVREAFIASMTDKAPDARRQAWFRALKTAQQAGIVTVDAGDFVEVVAGRA
jgi:hypothetical protein